MIVCLMYDIFTCITSESVNSAHVVVQIYLSWNVLTVEDGNNVLSQNVSNKLALHVA